MSLAAPRARPRSPARVAPEARDRAIWLMLIAALTAIAFFLRLSQIHQSLLGDEVFTFQDIHGRSLGTVLNTVHTGGENSPPLFFVLAWLSAKLGDLTVWLRLPSIVLGSATVPLVYLLGRETVGRTAGLIGAAFMAVSPFAVFYGVEARSYATMMFFVVLSTLALVRASGARRSWWWLVYAFAAAAAAYSHYTCIFLLAVQAAWSLWACRDRLREPLLANALVVLLYLPWIPHLRGKALAVIGALHPLTVHTVLRDLVHVFPGHPSAPLRAIPTVLGLIVVVACALLGLVHLVRQRARRSGVAEPGRRSHLLLLAALAAATPIGLLLYSLLATDLWLPRGLAASLPAFALVLGALLAGLPRALAALTVAAVIVTLVLGTVRSFDAAYNRGPFRGMAAYFDRVAGPGDPLIMRSIVGAGAISVQLRKAHPVVPLSPAVWSMVRSGGSAYLVLDDNLARLARIATPHPRGFALVGRKHYSGPYPTSVLIYRRQAAAP